MILIPQFKEYRLYRVPVRLNVDGFIDGEMMLQGE